MPPEPPRRRFPSVTSEPNEARGPHTPVPEAPTSPPPAMPMAPPRAYAAPRRPVVAPPLSPPAAASLRDYEEEVTLHGLGGPASEAPSVRDSQEVSTDSLLRELASKATEARAEQAARRAAEKRAHEAELKAQAAESGVNAQGPRFSLGSAKWWAIVLGALALTPTTVTQVKGWFAPAPVSAPQVDALKISIDELNKTTRATNETLAKRDANDAKRWTLAAAALCAQGFRARGLDCDAVQKYADFQPMPLVGPHAVRGAPQWKADATWPALPIPSE